MLHRLLLAASLLGTGLGLVGCNQPPPPAASTPPAAATPAAASAPAAPARPAAPSVADLVGARGSSGESELQSRGYTPARTRGLTAYWWHLGGACVRVVTNQGRYQTVENVAASNCGH
ncbi:hypothetical protein [Roseomonas sp. AR75]|uniref:hypothetical protein n=1 Tax=Roseomonas sp. AR75 TaxID=2562311 RepID=UPI00197ECF08|nr:hypothetical protein [Roseomonas sp. AR75]